MQIKLKNKTLSKLQDFFRNHIGHALFIGFLVISLFTFKEYGVAWDEPIQRTSGQISYSYVFSGSKDLLKWRDRDYGVVVELPLVILEKMFRLNDSRDIHFMRHLLLHVFFLVGCFYLFRLVMELYQNKFLAAVSFLLLALHPGIYGHSFFNSKDIPFLSMFVISVYYAVIALKNRREGSFVKLGVCIGLLINMRIMGILLPVSILALLLLDFFQVKEKKKTLVFAVIMLLVSGLTLYATWPFLWADPFERFAMAFQNMSKFRWTGKVLLHGKLIPAASVPWSYIPTWFGISTPLLYQFFAMFGIVALLLKLASKPKQFLQATFERNNALFLALFVGPVFAVIILKSTLYDSWRQLYFIYPFFVLLAIYGIDKLLKTGVLFAKITRILLLFGFLQIGIFEIRNFPMQHVYINELVSKNPSNYLRKNYEMDYWGVSYKLALEHILKQNKNKSIKVAVANDPGIHNLSILKKSDRERIEIVEPNEARYYITNYRINPESFKSISGISIYTFEVQNSAVIEIFKLP